MRFLIAAALVLTAGLAFPASAAADHGRASVTLTLRFGPSLDYRRITVIPDGRRVYVRRCTPRLIWCEVRYGRYIGWVRARYLIHPDYGRPYSYLDARLDLPIFDFFAHITDFDRDRHHRRHRYRHDDDYYRDLRRRHRRHHHGRRHRGHRRHHREGRRDGGRHHKRRHRDRDHDRDHRRRRRHRDRNDGDGRHRGRRKRGRHHGDDDDG